VRRLALLLAAAALLAAPAALAAEVKDLDASEYPRVRLTVVAETASTPPPTVRENGRPVAGLEATNLGDAKSVVLVIDRSRSMGGQPLADAVAAARAFIAAKPPEDRIAIATFGREPLLLTDFSTATIDADIALRTLSVDDVQGTKLYDTVALSADALAAEPLPSRVIIMVTDGQETRSDTTLAGAVAAAQNAGVVVYVVGIESARFRPEPLRELATETGGNYYGTASTEALTAVYSSLAEELGRTWQLEYFTSARPRQELELGVEFAGGDVARTRLTMPSVAGAAVTPKAEPSPLLPEFFYTSRWGGPVFAGVVGLLVLIAAALAFAAPRGAWLKGRLAPHVSSRKRELKRARERERFVLAASLFRATENAFGKFGRWRQLERTLERADVPLRAGEFVYIMAGAGLGLGFFAAVAGLPFWAIGSAVALGTVVPYVVVAYKARRRLREFEDQLPDILVTMAASLKAGHSFRQGVQSVVDEGQEPASKEFRRVLTETQLGRPMDDALGDMAERVGSKNFEFVMNAVTIQRQVGGSLAGLFDMVADTVRQRQQFARKIRGLTAMGRMSAYVLVGLPFFVFGAIFLINRDYISPLVTTSTGHKMIAATAVMMTVGSLMLKKIVSFRG
jgi:tight adherence protein B